MKELVEYYESTLGSDFPEFDISSMPIDIDCEPSVSMSVEDFLSMRPIEQIGIISKGVEITLPSSLTEFEIYEKLQEVNRISYAFVVGVSSGFFEFSYKPVWVLIPDSVSGKRFLESYIYVLSIVETMWAIQTLFESLIDFKDTISRTLQTLCFPAIQLVPEWTTIDEDGFITECFYGPWITYADNPTLSDGCSLISSQRPMGDILEEIKSEGIVAVKRVVTPAFEEKIEALFSVNGCWGETSPSTWLAVGRST